MIKLPTLRFSSCQWKEASVFELADHLYVPTLPMKAFFEQNYLLNY